MMNIRIVATALLIVSVSFSCKPKKTENLEEKNRKFLLQGAGSWELRAWSKNNSRRAPSTLPPALRTSCPHLSLLRKEE
jgi:hypothetical protein